MKVSIGLIELAQNCQVAARELARLGGDRKNEALKSIADCLARYRSDIIAANVADCEVAGSSGLSKSLYARLKFDETKLNGAIAGVLDVIKLADPVGMVQIHRELDEGLILKRITCPVGVLGVIFEARPDAVVQIASLAVKSGNGVILKGGAEAINSNSMLVKAIRQGLMEVELNPDLVQLLTTREDTINLLKLDAYVNLIIPRGSNSFVKFVQDNTRIPVLGHAQGICHLYVDRGADISRALEITVDAKTQYPAACNAIETLLVHEAIAADFLPELVKMLPSVELRGDAITAGIIDVIPACDPDWITEYGDLILSIKVVKSVDQAIAHINGYGSKHTEAIVTEDQTVANQFLAEVEAAGVFHNCSTRFADGFRYGFGAEVGISTQMLPPRGPVGLEGLVTYKYLLLGNGHVVASYSGKNPKSFSHRDLFD